MPKSENRQKLAYIILVLAYQFASPVRKTQDLLFTAFNFERLIEIGPSPTLTGMATRTLKAKYEPLMDRSPEIAWKSLYSLSCQERQRDLLPVWRWGRGSCLFRWKCWCSNYRCICGPQCCHYHCFSTFIWARRKHWTVNTFRSNLSKSFLSLGKYSTGLISRLIGGKTPGGFNSSAIKSYLGLQKELGVGILSFWRRSSSWNHSRAYDIIFGRLTTVDREITARCMALLDMLQFMQYNINHCNASKGETYRLAKEFGQKLIDNTREVVGKPPVTGLQRWCISSMYRAPCVQTFNVQCSSLTFFLV